jgi:hypothetical protein
MATLRQPCSILAGPELRGPRAPALQGLNGKSTGGRIESEASGESDVEAIRELLIDQMRDLLHAEKRLVKGLPKMVKAANHQGLAGLFKTHLAETEGQVERLNEGLQMLNVPARAKACKGMMGLLEEGDEVIAENGKKGEALADLALIGAESGALRDFRLHHRAQSGATAEDARAGATTAVVACRRGERGPVAQPGCAAFDVSRAYASRN